MWLVALTSEGFACRGESSPVKSCSPARGCAACLQLDCALLKTPLCQLRVAYTPVCHCVSHSVKQGQKTGDRHEKPRFSHSLPQNGKGLARVHPTTSTYFFVPRTAGSTTIFRDPGSPLTIVKSLRHLALKSQTANMPLEGISGKQCSAQ